MARPKSALRRMLTSRYALWLAGRGTVAAIPALARALHFYPRGLAALDAADVILEDRRWYDPLPFTAELARFVQGPCRLFDTVSEAYRAGEPVEFFRQALIIRKAEVQGSTGSIVLPHLATTVNISGQRPNWNFSRPKRLRNLGQVQGLAIHSYKTTHYFHFLLDNAWPLVDAIDRYGISSGTVIRYGQSAIQDAFFKGIAQRYPEIGWVRLAPDECISVNEILRLAFGATNYEWSLVDRAGADKLGDIFRDAYCLSPPKRSDRRIFLSRDGAKLRRLRNEPELIKIAEEFGFEPFVAHESNHVEQVRIFSEASHIIAVHGAGLANLLFVPKGARLLELFPSNFTKSTFAWLAARLGIKYRWLVGTKGDYDQSFRIDPAQFRECVRIGVEDASDVLVERPQT